MPHDRNGTPLQVGDEVAIPARVTGISEGEEYCNVSLETAEAMFPGDAKTTISLNAKQVEKALTTATLATSDGQTTATTTGSDNALRSNAPAEQAS